MITAALVMTAIAAGFVAWFAIGSALPIALDRRWHAEAVLLVAGALCCMAALVVTSLVAIARLT